MTQTLSRTPPGRRDDLHLVRAQLRGIEAFNVARRTAIEAATATARTRELRMDANRRLDVLRRQHDRLVARSDEQLREAGATCWGRAPTRAVLAHRSEWFLGRLGEHLHEHGVHVVARTDNGADAVGVSVAEQPDLLLVEDSLAMVAGEQVVREVQRFCPDTLVAAQCSAPERVGPLLEAGARTVFTRRVTPGEVAEQLAAFLAEG